MCNCSCTPYAELKGNDCKLGEMLLFNASENPSVSNFIQLLFVIYCAGGNYVISASSWREGQKLVKKLLGPAPKIEHDRRAVSSDRTGRERTAKSGKFFITVLSFIVLNLLHNFACLQD